VRRVLITGGAGFLGSHVCDALIGRGDEVVCLDNYITGARSNVEHLLGHERFSLAEHDIRSPFPLDAKVDIVLHLASPASPPAYLAAPIETLEVGSLGTRNALELAREHGARFLLASTSEVYGDPEVSPQPETYRGSVSTTGPRSVYDESKRYAEALVMAYHRSYGLETRIVRIFNTYGPRLAPGDGRALSNFIKQALQNVPLTVYGDGLQTRSFCYVDDLVGGILALVDSDEVEPVNIGNPDERTILEVAKLVIEKTGSRSAIEMHPLPVDDPLQRRPDIAKAKALLGWEPRVALTDGLDRTIEWFRSELETLPDR
jgi:nucleoside-diphosphate-sugar epimerase